MTSEMHATCLLGLLWGYTKWHGMMRYSWDNNNFSSLRFNAAFDAVNYNTDWLAEDFGQDLLSEVSTWSFITRAALWKDHWFAHAAGWHWPEASDHLLGSAGLIIYPVAYCLRCTASLQSRPPETHCAASSQLFYNAEAGHRRILPSTKNYADSLSHLI